MLYIRKFTLFLLVFPLSLYVRELLSDEPVVTTAEDVAVVDSIIKPAMQEENLLDENLENETDCDQEDEEMLEETDASAPVSGDFAIPTPPHEDVILIKPEEIVLAEELRVETPLALESSTPDFQISALEHATNTSNDLPHGHDEHPVEDEDFDLEDEYCFEEEFEEEDKHTPIKIQPRKPVSLSWYNTVAVMVALMKDTYNQWTKFFYNKFSALGYNKKNIKNYYNKV